METMDKENLYPLEKNQYSLSGKEFYLVEGIELGESFRGAYCGVLPPCLRFPENYGHTESAWSSKQYRC